ncbi:PAS domain-containing protein [Hymenobacter sp. B1770]|uniref:PAS domain-containing protein n=1 Tax=Hymenobacter sp. B1770 TaxID=1718788 RepID=UPI003CF99B92
MPLPLPDLLPAFNAQPGATLLLSPEWVIVGASDDYLAATLTQREVIVGQFIFDAFPDNPDNPEANAVANVRASLEQVMVTKRPHEMALQHYDVPDPAQPGHFVERHWRPRHTPVLGASGEVQFIIQSVQDITASRRAERQLSDSQAGEQVARADARQQRAEFRHFLEQAPVAVAVYRGPRFVVETANATTLAIWDRPLDAVLGRPVFEALPEAATPEVRAIFEHVFATGTPHAASEQRTTLLRHGRPEEVYWNMVFEPQRDADGRVSGIFTVGTDVTAQVRARQQVEQLNQELEARVQERTEQVRAQSQRLERLFMQAPAAICILAGPKQVFELVNPIYQQFFPQRQLLGKPLLDALPELADHAAYHSMRQVYDTGKATLQQALHVPLARTDDGVLEDRYFNYVQQPRYDEQGRTDGVLIFGFEVTELVQAQQRAEGLQAEVLAATQRQVQERETFYQIFEQTPAAICIQRGPEHRYEYINAAYQAFFPGRVFLGRSVAEVLPETVDSGVVALLDRVYQTGETYFGEELPLFIAQPEGPPKQMYFTFTYQALREAGRIVGISTFAYDVTEQVRARQSREAQQRKFYTLFEQAPIGICTFAGPDWTYEFVNDSYQRLLPGRQLLGRPLLEVLPELAGTHVERLLRRVYETGVTQQQQAALIPVARHTENGEPGELEERYFTVVCQARRDEQGCINGILNFAIEVTEQVQASQREEENREELKRFKFMADQARDPFILMRADGSFAYLNQRALEAWGYSVEEMQHLRVPDLDPIYQKEAFDGLFAQAQQEAIPLFETLHRRKDGYVFPVEVSAAGLQLDGQPHLLVVARNITEQKRYVAALQESEARFRTMADAAPHLVWAVHPDSSIRYINRAFLDFVGLETVEDYSATG